MYLFFPATWLKNAFTRFHRLNPSVSWRHFAIVSASMAYLDIMRHINHLYCPSFVASAFYVQIAMQKLLVYTVTCDTIFMGYTRAG